MGVEQYVDVEVSETSPGVTEQGFGIALLPSFSAAWAERTRTYVGIDGVGSDFATTSLEYLAAANFFAQTPHPPSMMIGRCANKPTQRWSIFPLSVNATSIYKVLGGPLAGTIQTASYTALPAVAWVHSVSARVTGDLITNDTGKLYVCITAGADGNAGGPTGTNADITDGAAHWMYAGAGGVGVASNDAIVYNLKKQIDAFSPALDATSSLQGSAGSKTLRLLVNTAAEFIDIRVGDIALLTIAQDHADPGIAADLDAIFLESKAWYGLCPEGFNSSALLVAAAGWAESNKRLMIADSGDSAIQTTADGSATDVAHVVKGSSRRYTAIFAHPICSDFAGIAEASRFFATKPGSSTWRLKSLSGPSAQNYTATQITNMEAKRCNYLYTLEGVATIGGKAMTAVGEFIDVVVGIDWDTTRRQTRLVNLLLQNDKVPYTDAGISLVGAEMMAQNDEGIRAGLVADDPKPTVVLPKAIDVPDTDRQTRQLNNVDVAYRLAGAIHFIGVNVKVTF